MDTVTLFIDGREVKAKEGRTVLEAAREAGIYIPSLCYHPDLSPFGACRLCIVEIEEMRGFPPSCTTPVADGMVVHTNTSKLQKLRRDILELTLTEHPYTCLTCEENLGCELQQVARYIGLKEVSLPGIHKEIPIKEEGPLFVRDYNLCILCGRCVRACQELRGVGAIAFTFRGKQSLIGTAFDRPLEDSGCKFCTACVEVCPTGALRDKEGGWKTEEEKEAALVPCKPACPAGVDVPRYVALIARGKFAEAVAVIREKVPFPGVLGRVCIHPCEEACRRGQVNDPINIRILKRFAADHDNGLWKERALKAPATGKKVAIVGAGPAGLTAAYYLAKFGHGVTVFEELPEPGGMMKVGIPDYRLPTEVLRAEIAEIESVGVEIRTGTRVESLDGLFNSGYQAVFLGLGAHGCASLRVEGEDCSGVIWCATFLREVNLGREVKIGKKVVVVGGGNAAVDAARTALRLGAAEVIMLYRRTRVEMPANAEEVDGAIEEGVDIQFLSAPKGIKKAGDVIKMECFRMELGEPDASGRRRPQSLEGSEFILECDNVIVAIGQKPQIPQGFELETRGNNTLVVDDSLAAGREGVFAGGDVVSGPASVIEAIAAGRQAAESIDKYLGGKGFIDEVLVDAEEDNPCLGHNMEFAALSRAKTPSIPMERRLNSFAEIELGLEEAVAIAEAERCLKCPLRLQLSPPWLPPAPVR